MHVTFFVKNSENCRFSTSRELLLLLFFIYNRYNAKFYAFRSTTNMSNRYLFIERERNTSKDSGVVHC